MDATNAVRNEVPMPIMSLKTRILSADVDKGWEKRDTLYVNLLQSAQCQPLCCKLDNNAPVTADTRISDILVPLRCSKVMRKSRTATATSSWRCDVVFHDSVFHRARASKLFKRWIIECALRRIESENSMQLHREYKLVRSSAFVGRTAPKPVNNQSIRMQSNGSDQKRLSQTQRNTPKYTVSEQTDVIKVRIDMHRERSIRGIELDCNASQLCLRSVHYTLTLSFPRRVDPDKIRARFNTKKHRLKLTLPIEQI